MIKEISLDCLIQHPKNVRKNYGDLAELTESVRVMGVLQNLVVTPDPEREGCYLIIAGNCRYQAAVQAGLESVPCSIVEMTEKEQIQTMLTENMQRKNLTVLEEAQGVQMCLDLGISEKDLAQKTGLSRDTIRTRKKIASLNLTEEPANATIEEYLKVAELEDENDRNDALKVIGTNNFNMRVNSLKEKEQWEKEKVKIIAIVSTVAEERKKLLYYGSFSKSWYIRNEKAAAEAVKEIDKDKNNVYVVGSYMCVYLYTLEEPEESKEETEAERENRERRRDATEQGKSWADIARTTRMNYIREMLDEGTGKYVSLIYWLSKIATGWDDPDMDIWDEVMEKETDEYEDETSEEEILSQIKDSPAKALVLIYSTLEIRKGAGLPTMSGSGKYHESESYKDLYDFMMDFGYRPSEEEKKLLDGTHEIFIRDDED